MAHTVYFIDTYDAGGNSHSIGIRQENWVLRKRVFLDLEEAKEFVRQRNRHTSVLPQWLILLPEEERPAFVDTFCFSEDNPKYQTARRCWLSGGDPKAQSQIILDQLKADGVCVVMSEK